MPQKKSVRARKPNKRYVEDNGTIDVPQSLLNSKCQIIMSTNTDFLSGLDGVGIAHMLGGIIYIIYTPYRKCQGYLQQNTNSKVLCSEFGKGGIGS